LEYLKKKGTSRRRKETQTDEESIGGNNYGGSESAGSVQHVPDKRNYINQWMAKMEKFRDKVEEDRKYYYKLHKVGLKT